MPKSNENETIRVLVAKPGLDGHDRGAKVIAKALRDAGMEVIYTGLHQTPAMIVKAALDEDVQVIGLSILSGAHNKIIEELFQLLDKEKAKDDFVVILGGIIPPDDHEFLYQLGVKGIFTSGSSFNEMIQFIHEHCQEKNK